MNISLSPRCISHSQKCVTPQYWASMHAVYRLMSDITYNLVNVNYAHMDTDLNNCLKAHISQLTFKSIVRFSMHSCCETSNIIECKDQTFVKPP